MNSILLDPRLRTTYIETDSIKVLIEILKVSLQQYMVQKKAVCQDTSSPVLLGNLQGSRPGIFIKINPDWPDSHTCNYNALSHWLTGSGAGQASRPSVCQLKLDDLSHRNTIPPKYMVGIRRELDKLGVRLFLFHRQLEKV